MSFNNVGRGQASAYFNNINSNLDNLSKQSEDPRYDPRSWTASPSNLLDNRKPWIISTTELLRNGQGLVWYCNPSDASWKIRLRQATTKNAHSTVTHNWNNTIRNNKFDEIVLTLNFQSGNLVPYKRNADVNERSSNNSDFSKVQPDEIPPGIVNFYDFLSIMNAPALLANGETNHIVIKYHSNIFPSMTLIGQFDPEGVSFSDSADNAANINSWSASFIIYDTNPRLSETTTSGDSTKAPLISHYLENMGIRRG